MAAPNILCDTAGMTNAQWLAARMHGPSGKIPYTVGGSDVAAVFGVSPWTTPLELWMIKKGRMKPPAKSNANQLEMGHLSRRWCGWRSGKSEHPSYTAGARRGRVQRSCFSRAGKGALLLFAGADGIMASHLPRCGSGRRGACRAGRTDRAWGHRGNRVC